jgi:hypothetical protein
MPDTKIVLQGSRRPVAFCPVSAEIGVPPGSLAGFTLVDTGRGLPVPFQVLPGSGKTSVLHWIVDSAAAGQLKEYVLEASGPGPQVSGVELSHEDGRIRVGVGGQLLTNYLYGDPLPRSCLYPVMGPFGQGVTRAYPQEEVPDDSTDHIHHRSVWVAWGDVNGSDNWSEEKGHGLVVHREFEAVESGPVFGRIASRNDWVNASGEKLMEDRTEYRFYNVPPSFRLIDLTVTFSATEGDVRFGDTKEGGIISVRMAAPLEGTKSGLICNSHGGVTEAETWGKRASWCDYSGTLEGHEVGIALFDHPQNLRYPTYWHVRDYGLMTANPFGLSFFVDKSVDGSYVLSKGGNLTFRYRMLVHAGDAEEGAVGSRYLDWVFPPTAAAIE